MTPVSEAKCGPAPPKNEAEPALSDRPLSPASRRLFGYWIVPTDQKNVSPEESATPSLSVMT